MAKKMMSEEAMRKKAIGLLDNRSTDNAGLLIKRDQKVTMLDIFGTEQKTAVAYFVSDLLAKGFNNQQIIETISKKYGLEWNIRQVNVVKALLHKMWRCEIAHTMNDQIAREVATIDTQIKEAWEAWEFSKKGIKKKQTRTTQSDSPADELTYNVSEVILDENTTAGDVHFLEHINVLGKEKRKLLGLYAPEKKADGGGLQTAVQFNIVGDGAGGEIVDMMASIMKGAPIQQPESKPQVEEANYQEVKETSEEDKQANIDRLLEEVIGEM